MGKRIPTEVICERQRVDRLIAQRLDELTRQTQVVRKDFVAQMLAEAEEIIAEIKARERASISDIRGLIAALLDGAQLELQKRALMHIRQVLKTAPLKALVDEACATIGDAAGDQVVPVLLRLPVDWHTDRTTEQLAQLRELWPRMKLEESQAGWPQVILEVENGGAVVDPVTFGAPETLAVLKSEAD